MQCTVQCCSFKHCGGSLHLGYGLQHVFKMLGSCLDIKEALYPALKLACMKKSASAETQGGRSLTCMHE